MVVLIYGDWYSDTCFLDRYPAEEEDVATSKPLETFVTY